jgi:hypothetical protein
MRVDVCANPSCGMVWERVEMLCPACGSLTKRVVVHAAETWRMARGDVIGISDIISLADRPTESGA